MTPQQFRWIDRDTAARDLLQLVFHAPGYLHEQALKLLEAIRSPAILPELKAIVLDPEYDVRQRRVAFDVIIATPGNVDFHEFETVLSDIWGDYNAPIYAARLTKHHPVNLSWILNGVEAWSPSKQYNTYLRLLYYVPQLVGEPLLKLVNEHSVSLDLNTAELLYHYGGDGFRQWLSERWDEVIHLWLTVSLYSEAHDFWKRLHLRRNLDTMLDKWPDLKDSLQQITSSQLTNCVERENVYGQREIYLRLLKYAPQAADRLLNLLDENPGLLDLEIADLLYRYGNETVKLWLRARWDELIYLCLITSVVAGIRINGGKVWLVYVLESWSELKDAVFHNCPAIVEEYTQQKALYDETDFQSIDESEIKALPIWAEFQQRYSEWVEQKKKEPRHHLPLRFWNYKSDSEADIPMIAAEIYFLGSLQRDDNAPFDQLPRLLEDAGNQWQTRVYLHIWDDLAHFVYSPIRFEAAYALRNTVNPRLWGLFVEIFFIHPSRYGVMTNSMLERYLLRWITRLTDLLSDVEPELPDEELPLNIRPWLCQLVKANRKQTT